MTRALHVSDALSLPLELVTESVGILAVKRAGKSHTAKKIVEQLHAAKQQIVVVDPKGDWWGLRSSADGKGPGIPIVILGGEHGDVPLEPGSGELVAKMVVEQRVSVLLDLAELRKHQVATFMTAFLETLYRLKAKELYRTPLMLVIDEADAIAPQRPQKGEERMLGAAEDIVRRGGQRGIGIVLVSQRAAVLNKNVLTQVGVLILLRTTGSQDIDAVDEWIKKHGQQEKREKVMASIAAMPRGTAWVWAPGWPDERGIFKQVPIAPCETFDSGATPKPGEQRVVPKTVADVDLDAFRKEMAATIEKAKAEDPKELRREIATLKAQLTKRPVGNSQQPVRNIPQPKRVEVPILKDAQIKRLEQLAAKVDTAAQKYAEWWRTAGDLMGDQVKALAGAATEITQVVRAALAPQVVHGIDPGPLVDMTPGRIIAVPPGKRLADFVPPSTPFGGQVLRPRANADGPRSASGTLPKGEAAVLTAIAQQGGEGLAREEISVLAGYAKSSRDAYLYRLREKHLVFEIGDGRIGATSEGRAALGDDFEPLPTGPALQAHWLARLPAGEALILRALLERPNGQAVLREHLTDRTGYQKSTRDAYLYRLRMKKLVLDEGRGAVKASPTLF